MSSTNLKRIASLTKETIREREKPHASKKVEMTGVLGVLGLVKAHSAVSCTIPEQLQETLNVVAIDHLVTNQLPTNNVNSQTESPIVLYDPNTICSFIFKRKHTENQLSQNSTVEYSNFIGSSCPKIPFYRSSNEALDIERRK